MSLHAARLLVTATGRDHPELLARLLHVLANAGAALHDVEQVVVQGQLTLCLLVTPTPGLAEALEAEARALGIDLHVGPVPEPAADGDRSAWVVTLIGDKLGPSALEAVARVLASHGAHVRGIRRLTEDDLSALEIMFTLSVNVDSQASMKRALLGLSMTERFDIAVQPDDVHRRSKRLVVMDMDSTLIRIEVIDELAKAAGVGTEVAEITRRAMAGEMDYDESLRRRVALLEGLDASHLDRIARDLPLSDGVETLIAALQQLGLRTAVISGGFDIPAKALQRRLGLDDAHSNELEVKDGKLTGQVVGRVVNARVKAELLEQIAHEEGIPLEQTVAIGDGANDLLMIQKAGLGIAFHGKPKLREAAHSSLTGGLDTVLYLLGLGTREIRSLREASLRRSTPVS